MTAKSKASVGTLPNSLSAVLSKEATFKKFSMWLIGDTPLIVHAWSHKAKREMLEKQVKATKPGKEARDPDRDFVDSLYTMGEGVFGFPVTGVKNAILSAAHKDKGIARTGVKAALYLNAEWVRVGPAKAGAICDMPLVRIWGSEPEMREDMVRIGAGLQKTANLAYRGQFTTWGLRIVGEYNTTVLKDEVLAFLVNEAGRSAGLGEWRNERNGVFGAFHLASISEESAWEAYSRGKGKLPTPDYYETLAAAE